MLAACVQNGRREAPVFFCEARRLPCKHRRPWMAVLSELRRRRMTPSIAAGRAGKARLSEHRDVRVRAGARPARSAGQSSQPDVGETVMPAPMALVTFPERTRAVGRRGKRHGCRASTCLKASISLTLPSVLTHLASLSRERERGYLDKSQLFHRLVVSEPETPSRMIRC